MKRAIAIAAIVLMLTGCATTQLSSGATAAEKKAVMCSDAQMGYALSQAMLSQFVTSPEALKYWTAYKVGAELALKQNCM
jgi:hypothetical protein